MSDKNVWLVYHYYYSLSVTLEVVQEHVWGRCYNMIYICLSLLQFESEVCDHTWSQIYDFFVTIVVYESHNKNGPYACDHGMETHMKGNL